LVKIGTAGSGLACPELGLPTLGFLVQLLELLAHPLERQPKFSHSTLFLVNHGNWRPRDKACVIELRLGLGDLTHQPIDFFTQSLALGGQIDFNLEHQPRIPDELNRRSCPGRQFGDDRNGFDPG
jgi:hypothetical protein